MAMKTKVRKIGNSLGIILPREALETLKVGEGDTVYLTDAPEQTLMVKTQTPEFETMLAIAEEGMRRYRNALAELAK